MQNSLSTELVGFFSWALFSLLGKTWRYSFSGNRDTNPLFSTVQRTVYCFWHANILFFAYGFRNCDMTTVVSASRDGDMATALAHRWGQHTIRGSSSRKGIAALRQCVRLLNKNKNIVLVPDGPKGPPEIVKPGIAHIALMARAPVVPLTAVVHSAWRLNSWDRFVIPKPFSRIDITFHDPIFFSESDTTENSGDRISHLIQETLSR
ncbi:MAG: DUF374 domain-containing protein [Chitinivibrionales bacterium]|nr:DUF374 domain-containing protein [Chitinivibrionales bacterium]